MRLFSTLMILPRSGRTAWVLRSRPCLAEPPAESPSTTKSSARRGSLTEQSASLPGRRRVLERRLAAGQVAGLAGRLAGAGGLDRLADDPRAPRAGFSSRNSPSLRLTVSSTRPSIGGLPSLVFVWPSNCGSWSFTEITAVSPSRTSSPARFSSFSLSRPLLARVGVQRPGQRRAEAGEVGAALVGVDVVGEAEDRLLVGGVPLHRDLDLRRRRSRPRSRRSCGAAASLFSLRWATKSSMPPSYWKVDAAGRRRARRSARSSGRG